MITCRRMLMLPVCLCRSSLFLVWDLLGAASDLNYWVHRSSCCWSLDQYYMKHIPSQGRIGLGSLGLVPQNDLKSRVLQGNNLWLVSEMWCVGCFDRNFLKPKLIKLRENSMTDYKLKWIANAGTRTRLEWTNPFLTEKNSIREGQRHLEIYQKFWARFLERWLS